MRTREEARGKEIYVLVDRLVNAGRSSPQRARTSLWSRVLPSGSFDEISISDEKEAGRPVRINAARRMVIVNWDAANGDYVCGSDDTFLYFLTRQDRRDALLSAGGIILCECQSGRGQPYQAAYDAIFGSSQVEVINASVPPELVEGESSTEAKWNNDSVHTFAPYRSFYPIIRELSSSLRSSYIETVPLFNFDDQRPQETFYRYKYRQSLYNGWFCSWGKGWVPLLVADLREPLSLPSKLFSPPPAVLLAKCELGGVMLASTMWIAGSKCTELTDSILQIKVDEVKKAHKRIAWRRRLSDTLFGLALCLILAVGAKHFPVLRGGVLSDLGLFWSSLILLRLWLHLVWRRPYGVSVLQFAGRGLQNFWETV